MNNSTTKRHTHEQVVFGENMAAMSSGLEGEVYVAELVEESPASGRRELNLSMLSTVAISIVFLLLAMSLAMRLFMTQMTLFHFQANGGKLLFTTQMDLPMDTMRAQLPVNGTMMYCRDISSIDLPLGEQDVGSPGADLMHVALWLPDVEEE